MFCGCQLQIGCIRVDVMLNATGPHLQREMKELVILVA